MMNWVTSTDHMALAGMIISSATVIAGFRMRWKQKAGIPPPYSSEVAALITVAIMGTALVVFGR